MWPVFDLARGCDILMYDDTCNITPVLLTVQATANKAQCIFNRLAVRMSCLLQTIQVKVAKDTSSFMGHFRPNFSCKSLTSVFIVGRFFLVLNWFFHTVQQNFSVG